MLKEGTAVFVHGCKRGSERDDKDLKEVDLGRKSISSAAIVKCTCFIKTDLVIICVRSTFRCRMNEMKIMK